MSNKVVSILVESFETGKIVGIKRSISTPDELNDVYLFIEEHVGGRPDDRRVSISVDNSEDDIVTRKICLEYSDMSIPECMSKFIENTIY